MPDSAGSPASDPAHLPLILFAEGVWGPDFGSLAERYRIRTLDRPARVEDLEVVSVLVVRNRTRVDRELLAAPALRVVGRAGTGLDNIDIDAAERHGVTVVAAPGLNAQSVAEHAVGLALAVSRRIAALDARTRTGDWQRTPGRELAGRTWGLLSAGATGRATGRLAVALGMSALAYDPYADAGTLQRDGIRLGPLSEVLGGCDLLSIHLPSTPETIRMVNAGLLAQLRPEAIVINVGRGDVLDEAALLDALRTGRIAGAALDVREQEPPTPNGLEQLPNVVLTPHVAGLTVESQSRIAEHLCTGITAALTETTAADTTAADTTAADTTAADTTAATTGSRSGAGTRP